MKFVHTTQCSLWKRNTKWYPFVFLIFQKWDNPFLSWNPVHYNGIKVINVDPKLVWKPDLVLYNKWVHRVMSLLANKSFPEVPERRPCTSWLSIPFGQILVKAATLCSFTMHNPSVSAWPIGSLFSPRAASLSSLLENLKDGNFLQQYYYRSNILAWHSVSLSVSTVFRCNSSCSSLNLFMSDRNASESLTYYI